MAFRDRITVAVDFVTTGAKRGLGDLRNEVRNTEGGFNKLKVGAGGAFGFMKQHAVLAGAAIGTAIVGGAAKAISAASDLEESANAVDKVYGEASESVQKVGENAADSMGLSRRAFNEAAVAFGAFAKKIAGDGGNVTKVVATFTQRAADFASVMNMDVSESLRIFQSALAGETEPIRKFGIDMSAAAVKAHALSEGLIESGQTMDEGTKIQARYSLLMKSTSNTAGDFADTSDGLANSQRRLQANIENLAAAIGEELIPAAEGGTSALLRLVEVAEKLKVPEGLRLFNSELGRYTLSTDEARTGIEDVSEAQFMFIRSLTMSGVALDEAEKRWKVLEDNLSRTTESYNKVQAAISVAGREQRIATRTADDHRSSTVLVRRAIEDATDALRDEEAAFRDAAEAARDSADDHMTAEEAVWDHIESVERATEVLNDEEASLIDKGRAINDVVRATDDMVTAQLGLTEEQLKTEQGTKAWTGAMLEAANTLDGRMKVEVLEHIARVNGIPDEKITAFLANPDRAAMLKLEKDLDWLARNRTVNFIPRTTRATGFLGFSHTGSRFGTGDTKQILPGQAFIPDARFPFTAPTPGRMASPAETQARSTDIGRSMEVHVHLEGANLIGNRLPDQVARGLSEQLEEIMREYR